jgi:thioredoxin reductase (NADPH)
MMKNFDVVIIGGGVAGISAANWCEELGLQTLLLEENSELGGQLLWTFNPIENYLGIKAKNGREINEIFLQSIENKQFEIKLNAKIKDVNLATKEIILETGENFQAKFLVIATGVSRRKLNVKGENLAGVLFSGKRDNELVQGKRVCVVGGGDAALENALILSEKAEKVYLIHRKENFRGREEFISKVKQTQNIEVLLQTEITEIIGEKKVEAVRLNNGEILQVEAVLIRIGVEPNTKLFKEKLDLDKLGYIKINSNCETSLESIFAVGDVANPIAPTISSASGMGATAAKVIYSNLSSI